MSRPIPAWIAPGVLVWYQEIDGIKQAAKIVCWPYQQGSEQPIGDGEEGMSLVMERTPQRESRPLVRLRTDRTIVTLGLYPFAFPRRSHDSGEIVYTTMCGLDYLTRRDGCCYCGATFVSMGPLGPGGELVCGSCAPKAAP